MAQTTYCVELPSTSGHRLIQQVGTFTFPTEGAKTAPITVGFHKLVAGNFAYVTSPAKRTTYLFCMPYLDSSQIKECPDRIVRVTRATAGAFKTGTMYYSLYGY